MSTAPSETAPSETAPVTIAVIGEAEIHHPAERGTVRLTIGAEGPTRDEVVRQATALHASLCASIVDLHDADAGPVTWWANDQLRVWGQRPWSQTGEQLPIVHHSAASFTVKFKDFAALSLWVGNTSERLGVTIDGVSWDLTEGTRKRLTGEVQQNAVRAAVEKATIYANSLGLAGVTARELSDPGLLSKSAGATGGGQAMFAVRASAARTSETAELKPEEITLEATVHARFTAE